MLISSESPSPGCGFFRAYIQTFDIDFFLAPFHGLKQGIFVLIIRCFE